MVNLVLTPDQIRSAPHEVRDWLLALLAKEMAFEPGVQTTGVIAEAQPTLAECTPEEIRKLLEFLGADYLSASVLFEFGRQFLPSALDNRQPRRVPIGDILRQTRLARPEHLAACLDRIASAFREVNRNGAHVLFAIDDAGGIYVSGTTSRSIAAVWEAMAQVRPMLAEEAEEADTVAPIFDGAANAAGGEGIGE